MKRATAILALLSVLVVAFPDVAHACAVCFDAKAETRGAFLATTIFLSLLPLGLIGGGLYWIWKRSREMTPEDGTVEGPLS